MQIKLIDNVTMLNQTNNRNWNNLTIFSLFVKQPKYLSKKGVKVTIQQNLLHFHQFSAFLHKRTLPNTYMIKLY